MGDHQEMEDLKKIREMYQYRYPSEIQTLEWSLHGFMADLERIKDDPEISDKETTLLDYWDKWACNYVRLKKEKLTPPCMYLPTEDFAASLTGDLAEHPKSQTNIFDEGIFGLFKAKEERGGKIPKK